MILDNEYLSAIKRLAAGCEVNEETLAFDVVKEVGIGNSFIGHEHTASHFRTELWEPRSPT
jgi:trimethylamine---corrinoid protein Co-methyltransferase